MSCPVCSADYQLYVIIVRSTDYMCVKMPELLSKSCSDDSCYGIITTPATGHISNDDIRGTCVMT